jgi:hypothetical protein
MDDDDLAGRDISHWRMFCTVANFGALAWVAFFVTLYFAAD